MRRPGAGPGRGGQHPAGGRHHPLVGRGRPVHPDPHGGGLCHRPPLFLHRDREHHRRQRRPGPGDLCGGRQPDDGLLYHLLHQGGGGRSVRQRFRRIPERRTGGDGPSGSHCRHPGPAAPSGPDPAGPGPAGRRPGRVRAAGRRRRSPAGRRPKPAGRGESPAGGGRGRIPERHGPAGSPEGRPARQYGQRRRPAGGRPGPGAGL